MHNFAGAHAINKSADFPKFFPMGNETPAVDSSGGQVAQNFRNILFGAALTTFGTGEHATEMERECVNADALVTGHDTKQHAAPAAQFGQIVSDFDDFWISGAVDGDIG